MGSRRPSRQSPADSLETLPLVRDDVAYEDLLDLLWEAPRIAFDTEFVPERTYRPVLCLIQVATQDVCAAVDTLAIEDLSELWEALTRPDVELVVHAARAELAFCLVHAGCVPENVFDTQLASGIGGLGYPLSYTKLVKSLLGFEPRSAETRTDWERRPLTDAQIEYALDDVRYLLGARDKIGERLDALGRTPWYREEMVRVSEAVQADHEGGLDWRKTSGSGNLSGAELVVLRELALWRGRRAARLDRPLRHVMRDDMLVELAKRKPRGESDIDGVRGLGSLKQARWAEGIYETIHKALELPRDQWPERKRRHGAPSTPDSVHKVLSAILKQTADDHEIATSLLGTSDDLKTLLTWHQLGRPKSSEPRLARGWRRRVVGQTFLDLLDGRLLVGVINTEKHGLELEFVEDE